MRDERNLRDGRVLLTEVAETTNASVNSSGAHPPRANRRALASFFKKMANSQG